MTERRQWDDYRKYPRYGDIEIESHVLTANYNGAQFILEHSKGWLYYKLNYTWSKNMGEKGGYQNGNAGDSFNLRNDYGPLAYDRTNIFNASYNFDLGSRYHGYRDRSWPREWMADLGNHESSEWPQSSGDQLFDKLQSDRTAGGGAARCREQSLPSLAPRTSTCSPRFFAIPRHIWPRVNMRTDRALDFRHRGAPTECSTCRTSTVRPIFSPI